MEEDQVGGVGLRDDCSYTQWRTHHQDQREEQNGVCVSREGQTHWAQQPSYFYCVTFTMFHLWKSLVSLCRGGFGAAMILWLCNIYDGIDIESSSLPLLCTLLPLLVTPQWWSSHNLIKSLQVQFWLSVYCSLFLFLSLKPSIFGVATVHTFN